MSLLDSVRGKKTRNKLSKAEKDYHNVLTHNQNEIIRSYKYAAAAKEQEIKVYRSVLFSMGQLQDELGIDTLPHPEITPGSFNTSDFLADIFKNFKIPDQYGGKSASRALSQLAQSSSSELDSIGNAYFKKIANSLTKNNQEQRIEP